MDVLRGLRVVELASVLAGPEVGRFLAELGATVVKYEAPSGDVTRGWRLQNEDRSSSISAYFAAINAGKSYETINLKTEEGKAAIHEILENTDILLTNFKEGDDEQFGLSSRELKSQFPRLIWGKIGGFASEPSRPAFDVVLQAETGWMSMTGQPDSLPTKMPVALIDVLAAHQLKEAILLALYEREKTGKGSHWLVTLEEASLSGLANQATNYWMNDVVAQQMGTAHPNIAPYGDLLPTYDKKWAVPAIGSHAQFQSFCSILGIPDLASDLRFRSNIDRVSHRSSLIKELSAASSKLHSEVLSQKCHDLRVPLGIVKDLGKVLSEPTANSIAVEEEMDGRATKRVKSFVARKL
ncbi:CaiB/BaiF CoA transferase family protein [Phaeocystidibacter marisrubri]|uniref:CoA transferase n=1 Tax=Phaeocystidibacter marisrubri TaxID=1577780 RepID=A0A6L3ZDH9_9FLAO|nr:CoA transferase [Phaeocystidibacter marisrubri]KAB2815903.1 CoA transferase [Phaeocystidibacter marisrubri]GGH66315.1 CoA transferase [Phaeocystidibacter marisrubri]